MNKKDLKLNFLNYMLILLYVMLLQFVLCNGIIDYIINVVFGLGFILILYKGIQIIICGLKME